MRSILVTGSGCPGWYSVFRLLKEWEKDAWKYLRIFGCDSSHNPSGAALVDKNFCVPNGSEDGYVEEILRIVEENEIEAVLPLTDPELLPLSRAVSRFEAVGCRVLCSKEETFSLVLDKGHLYSRFPHLSPKFEYLEDPARVGEFIAESSDGESCFVKLTNAYGSRGTKKIVSDKTWAEGFEGKKPEAFGLTFPLSQVRKLMLWCSGHKMLVETLPGAEYSIDCIFESSGAFLFYGVREREMTRSGICHTAKFIPDSGGEFCEFIAAINRWVSFRHIINIQAKRDKDGALKLLEINPRVPGSIGSWRPVGYNLVGMMLDMLWGNGRRGDLTPEEYIVPHTFRVSRFI